MSKVTIELEDVDDQVRTRILIQDSGSREPSKSERFAEALLGAVEEIYPADREVSPN